MSWLTNQGLNYLTSGVSPTRAGNAHPNIVPYQVFATSDGYVIVAVGNDSQYARFCDYLGQPDWAIDPRFVTNTARLAHRDSRLIDVSCHAQNATVQKSLAAASGSAGHSQRYVV